MYQSKGYMNISGFFATPAYQVCSICKFFPPLEINSWEKMMILMILKGDLLKPHSCPLVASSSRLPHQLLPWVSGGFSLWVPWFWVLPCDFVPLPWMTERLLVLLLHIRTAAQQRGSTATNAHPVQIRAVGRKVLCTAQGWPKSLWWSPNSALIELWRHWTLKMREILYFMNVAFW